MAVLVSAETITVRIPERTVLDAVSLGVATGDRIGVLGLNGAGKTTLLSVLAQRREPDAGRVAVAGGARIVMVDQQSAPAPGVTVRQALLGTADAADHLWAADASMRQVLGGLGLGRIGLDTDVEGLSGGERRRVGIAAALITDADLLILDEPTNHLDIEAIDFLARHLLDRAGATVFVTHDRWFLDTVALRTWEVADGAVHIRDGGYSDWIFARAERERLAASAEERRRNLARTELAWLRRGPPARTAKPRYRIDAAEALIADVPEHRHPTELAILARHRLGRQVIDLVDTTVELPDGRRLLDGVTHLFGPGDRVAVLGPNGAGKSTLLRTLAGQVEPTDGTVRRGRTVRLGFLSQEPEPVDADLRVLDAIAEVAGVIEIGEHRVSASQLAERFGFSGGQQRQQVARLSGGERRRLQLLRVLATEPNVLLLDEPTNDLDTDTLASLEELLDGWAGTLIVVSHDRYFVERVTDTVLAMPGDGRLLHRPGGVDQYLAEARHTVPAAMATPTPAAPDAAADATALPAARQRQLRKDLQRLERQLESARRQRSRLHDELAAAGADYTAAAELDDRLRRVEASIDEWENAWLTVAEQLEDG